MLGASVISVNEVTAGKPFAFQITTEIGADDLILAAASATERDEWIAVFSAVARPNDPQIFPPSPPASDSRKKHSTENSLQIVSPIAKRPETYQERDDGQNNDGRKPAYNHSFIGEQTTISAAEYDDIIKPPSAGNDLFLAVRTDASASNLSGSPSPERSPRGSPGNPSPSSAFRATAANKPTIEPSPIVAPPVNNASQKVMSPGRGFSRLKSDANAESSPTSTFVPRIYSAPPSKGNTGIFYES